MKIFRKLMLLCLVLCSAFILCACDSSDYKKADEMFNNKQYAEAMEAFAALGDYQDSAERRDECCYKLAMREIDNGDYASAIEHLRTLPEDEYREKFYDAVYDICVAYVKENGTPFESELYNSLELGEYVKKAVCCQVDPDNSNMTFLGITSEGHLTAGVININSAVITEFKLILSPESKTARYTGFEYLDAHELWGAYSYELAETEIRLSEVDETTHISFTEYEGVTRDIYGNIKPTSKLSDSIFIKDVETEKVYMPLTVEGLKQLLTEIAPDLTPADLRMTAIG